MVSIHADGGPPAGRGFHVITPAGTQGPAAERAADSAALASALRDSLVAAGLTPATYAGDDGLDVRDDLATLNLSSVPTVMVEMANMRNAEDAAMIADPAVPERIADAIVAGITRAERGDTGAAPR